MWLIGDGSTLLNPVHGADLAAEVVRLLAATERDLARDFSGPNTFTVREMGELAFRALEGLGSPPSR